MGERKGFAVSFVKIRRGQLGYVIFPREDLPVGVNSCPVSI